MQLYDNNNGMNHLKNQIINLREHFERILVDQGVNHELSSSNKPLTIHVIYTDKYENKDKTLYEYISDVDDYDRYIY